MKQNEYNAAEVVEIGTAEKLILGYKDSVALDATAQEPLDRQYVET